MSDLRTVLEGIVADPDPFAADLEAALSASTLRVVRAVPGMVRRIVLEQATAVLAELPAADVGDIVFKREAIGTTRSDGSSWSAPEIDPWQDEEDEITADLVRWQALKPPDRKRPWMDEKHPITQGRYEEMRKHARYEAAGIVESMKAKVEQKTRGLTGVELKRFGGGEWTITGAHGPHRVRLEQQRVLKTSSKGNLFHQWPMRIYVDGQFTSEDDFLKLVGVVPEVKVKKLTKAQVLEARLVEGLEREGIAWRPTRTQPYSGGITFRGPDSTTRITYSGAKASIEDKLYGDTTRVSEADLFAWLKQQENP